LLQGKGNTNLPSPKEERLSLFSRICFDCLSVNIVNKELFIKICFENMLIIMMQGFHSTQRTQKKYVTDAVDAADVTAKAKAQKRSLRQLRHLCGIRYVAYAALDENFA